MSEPVAMMIAFAFVPFIILGGLKFVFWSIPLILDFIDRIRE